MVDAAPDTQIAIATDMAEANMWASLVNGPGLKGLSTQIIPRLDTIGCDAESIRRLSGATISSRLARKDSINEPQQRSSVSITPIHKSHIQGYPV
jgi:hypothetical protein